MQDQRAVDEMVERYQAEQWAKYDAQQAAMAAARAALAAEVANARRRQVADKAATRRAEVRNQLHTTHLHYRSHARINWSNVRACCASGVLNCAGRAVRALVSTIVAHSTTIRATCDNCGVRAQAEEGFEARARMVEEGAAMAELEAEYKARSQRDALRQRLDVEAKARAAPNS